jgi:hypothetical protein
MVRTAIGMLGLALTAGAAMSVHAQALPGTIALSPEERAAVLDAAARRPDTELPVNGLDRQIHGTMGVEIGSNGSRALFGSTVIPLGQEGYAAFSFLTGRQGGWR